MLKVRLFLDSQACKIDLFWREGKITSGNTNITSRAINYLKWCLACPLVVFRPTSHAKCQKLLFRDFSGFPPESHGLSIDCDQFGALLNLFQPSNFINCSQLGSVSKRRSCWQPEEGGEKQRPYGHIPPSLDLCRKFASPEPWTVVWVSPSPGTCGVWCGVSFGTSLS